MTDLDFSGQTALIVGGSSGIGNGIAQSLRARGAEVHIWGTRATAADYDDEDGSDLSGLSYQQMDVADFDAVANADVAFPSLIFWCSHKAPWFIIAVNLRCRAG